MDHADTAVQFQSRQAQKAKIGFASLSLCDYRLSCHLVYGSILVVVTMAEEEILPSSSSSSTYY